MASAGFPQTIIPATPLTRVHRPTFLRHEVGLDTRKYTHKGKAHKNCIIGQKFCLHHITGTAFIIRLKLYVYIVENSETFQKIYSFMQFK